MRTDQLLGVPHQHLKARRSSGMSTMEMLKAKDAEDGRASDDGNAQASSDDENEGKDPKPKPTVFKPRKKKPWKKQANSKTRPKKSDEKPNAPKSLPQRRLLRSRLLAISASTRRTQFLKLRKTILTRTMSSATWMKMA